MPRGSLFSDLLGLPSLVHQTMFGASEHQMQYLNYDQGTTATTGTTAGTTTVSPVIFFPSTDEAAKCNLTPGGSGVYFEDDLKI